MTTDLAMLADDPTLAEQAADPAQYVMVACERAKEWLTHALVGAHIEEIVEVKSQAEAIRVYTTQKQLGKDAELSAAEVVRRAERGIGLAIRKGQASGEIRSHGKGGGWAAHRESSSEGDAEEDSRPASPYDFVPHSTLYGDGREGGNGVYAMTDDVSEEAFEEAIAKAKGEGNLSRANVVRRARKRDSRPTRLDRATEIEQLAAEGYTSRQIASKMGLHPDTIGRIARDFDVEIPADKFTVNARHINSTRIARETVFAIQGAATGLDLIDYDDIDVSEVAEWATSLTESMREINRFVKKIKEMAHGLEQE